MLNWVFLSFPLHHLPEDHHFCFQLVRLSRGLKISSLFYHAVKQQQDCMWKRKGGNSDHNAMVANLQASHPVEPVVMLDAFLWPTRISNSGWQGCIGVLEAMGGQLLCCWFTSFLYTEAGKKSSCNPATSFILPCASNSLLSSITFSSKVLAGDSLIWCRSMVITGQLLGTVFSCT